LVLLTPATDLAPADWITGSTTPFERLITFGPAGFDAYARLRFIPDPLGPEQNEADVSVPDDHLHDLVQAQLALHRLSDFTESAADCFFLVWEGYSDVSFPPQVAETSMVVLPHRRYALFQGPLISIDKFAEELGSGRSIAPPAFVWPADHRWCFTSDVDPHWAGIGANAAAIDALVSDAFLDIVPARADEPQPLYY
jgi:hypothetical protein